MVLHHFTQNNAETAVVCKKINNLHCLIFLNCLLNFRMWLKYGLKAQKLQKQHALKGQKLLAQGIALGIIAISKAPCKGKSFVNCLVLESFCPYRATGLRP